MRLSWMMAALLVCGTPVLANDSTAELGAGGLELVRSDAIRMTSEDLSISTSRIDVTYQFENMTDAPVDTLVAFPMPALRADPYANVSVPYPESENFMGFGVAVDGRQIEAHLDQHAFAFGVEVTNDLVKLGVPLMPFSKRARAAIAALSPEVLADFAARGIVALDTYDIGEGMETHPLPNWDLQSAYWWRMRFPGGARVQVDHTYAPSLGSTAGIAGINYDSGKFDEAYVGRYCIDDDFQRAVDARMAAAADGGPPYWEQRLSYVLMTANNWWGPIGHFHLTIDKGDPANLVSFCADGVTKTGPTTFEVNAEDFFPERDLDILLLAPAR